MTAAIVKLATSEPRLPKLDALRRGLAEARTVDEVKNIRNEAEAMRVYARLAKDRGMEADAAEIRERAERRLGEIMAAQDKAGLKSKGGGTGANQHTRAAGVSKTPAAPKGPPTLDEAGIDKNLAKRARRKAGMSDKAFDKAVADMRNAIIEGATKNVTVPPKPKPKPKPKPRVAVDDLPESDYEPDIKPEAFQAAFLIRAEQAALFATYDGPLKPGWAAEFARFARRAALAWTALAERFEKEE